MSRDFQIPGESLISVKGHSASQIATAGGVPLGLCPDDIQISPRFNYNDLIVNAWGRAPVDTQWMNGTVDLTINLVHFDNAVLKECIHLSMAGVGLAAGNEGLMGRAGQRLGNNLAMYASGNYLVSLGISSPVQANPYLFVACHLTEQPVTFPLGVEAQIVRTQWRVIPYTQDPYGVGTVSGLGATGQPLWYHSGIP